MVSNANSRFSVTPSADISRSRFDRSFQHKTTFNGSELVPIYVDECLPGDTVSLDLSSLVRLSTPIFPTMDNAYLDVYFFFVPNRLVWNHWKEFMGENTESYWTPTTEYMIPKTFSPSSSVATGSAGWDKGSIADYMGVPTNVGNLWVSSLWFRAYCLIWNEWFRDQTTMQPTFIDFGDANTFGMTRAIAAELAANTAGISYAHAQEGSLPLPVCRFHDYFSSSLPQPQRGDAVQIPLFDADLPVTTLTDAHGFASYTDPSLRNVTGGNYTGNQLHAMYTGNGGPVQVATASSGSANDGSTANYKFIPANLGVEIENVAAATIMQLRQAFQIQKLLERDARGGGRYREVIHSHFGVVSPDSRMQVPEYLGGKRIPINIDQVLQTSETTETSPQGNTAAFSLTTDVSSMFTKSFTEHGLILGLCCVRTDNTYQQGLNRMFTRERRYDFYWPELANLSEQPVYRQEIFATEGAGSTYDKTGPNFDVFGYQEAWAEYRYKPSMVTGAFRSNYAQTLDSWHYADFYEGDPEDFVLQAEWMKSPARQNIDRTLAVQSSLEDQFIGDFYFKAIWTRPMPMYSIPGLADHH